MFFYYFKTVLFSHAAVEAEQHTARMKQLVQVVMAKEVDMRSKEELPVYGDVQALHSRGKGEMEEGSHVWPSQWLVGA